MQSMTGRTSRVHHANLIFSEIYQFDEMEKRAHPRPLLLFVSRLSLWLQIRCHAMLQFTEQRNHLTCSRNDDARAASDNCSEYKRRPGESFDEAVPIDFHLRPFDSHAPALLCPITRQLFSSARGKGVIIP